MGSWTATATRAGGLGPKEERLKIVPVGRARARVPSFVLLFSERTKGGPRCSTRALDSGYGSLFFAGSGSGSGFGWLWLSGSLALWLSGSCVLPCLHPVRCRLSVLLIPFLIEHPTLFCPSASAPASPCFAVIVASVLASSHRSRIVACI